MPQGVPFGEYRLLKRIGAGGMAEVFLAKRVGPGGFEKQLVIKRILPHLTESERFTQMFLREARLAAVVDHPNLVHVSSFGEIGGNYYLAMEYVDGITLADFIGLLGAVSAGVAGRIAIDLLGALHAIHTARDVDGRELGLVHRDVSPRNVMLTREGEVKLLDFGIAITREETMERVRVGTRRHMSPEQMKGDDLNFRSDLFCVGVLLFQMISGDVPFDDVTPDAVPARPEAIPPELWVTVEKALSIQPQGRPSAARQMQSALELFVASRGIEGTRAHLAELVSSVLAPQRPLPRALTKLTRFTKTGIKKLTAPLTAEEGAAESARVSAEIMGDVTSAPLRDPVAEPERAPLRGAWAVMGLVLFGAAAGLFARYGWPPDEAQKAEPPAAEANAPEPPKTPAMEHEAQPEPAKAQAIEAEPQPEPKAEPAPRERPKAKGPAGPGTLTIDTRPWTEVWAGGRKLGLTPMEGLKLPAGVHELELKNPNLGVSRKIHVTIRPGKVTRVQRDL